MTSLKEFLRTEIGERVEQSDFAFATLKSLRLLHESVVSGIITGDATSGGGQPQNLVIEGFASSDGYGTLPGTVVTINTGKAVMGLRDGGSTEQGVLVVGGAASRSRDMNGLGNGTYGVYVRCEFLDTRFVNRLFWNPLASTPVETPRSIPTRKTEDWGITIELTAPGPEWLLVATAAKTGSTVVLTDARVWLFDTADGTIADGIWGSSNDRNAARPTYGVKSLYRTLMAHAKQLLQIVGGTTWMASPISGTANGADGPRSLTALNLEKLAKNGAQAMTGNLMPNAANTLDIGTAGTYWRRIVTQNLDVGADATAARLTASTNVLSALFLSAVDENEYQFNGGVKTFYTHISVGEALLDSLLVTADQIRVVTGSPVAIANPNRLDVGIHVALAADTYITFPVHVPQGAAISALIIYMSNNGAAATEARVWRDDMGTGGSGVSILDLRGAGAFVIGSTATSRTAVNVTGLNQNLTVNNSAARLYVTIRCLAGTENIINGIRVAFTTDNVVIQG